MSIFVDASALVAIIRREADALDLVRRLEAEDHRVTSAVALWETTRAIGRDIAGGHPAAERETEHFRTSLGIEIVPIGAEEAAEAIHAHARYGKGTRHPAQLNMGDCFAYACARTSKARLLYKGDDFIHTDLG